MIDLSKIVLRRLLARLAFLAIGLLLIYYYVNHLFISQLSNPVLVYPDDEPVVNESSTNFELC